MPLTLMKRQTGTKIMNRVASAIDVRLEEFMFPADGHEWDYADAALIYIVLLVISSSLS